MIQKEIEAMLKLGLKDEADYSNLQGLYRTANLPNQSKLIEDIKKTKFPNGEWAILEAIRKFRTEKDIVKKEQMLDGILNKIKSDSALKYLESSLSYYQSIIPAAYIAKEDWKGMESAITKYDIKGASLASLYNNSAWEMQETDKNLQEAEKMSAMATAWAKNEWKKPAEAKPDYLTAKQWDESRISTYAMYADTYGMINYKLGHYKKGLLMHRMLQ
jgi:hypothetical protein